MAVCVCNADGATSPREREFLAGVAQAFALDVAAAQTYAEHASAVTSAPLAGDALDGALVSAVPADAAALDKMIVNYRDPERREELGAG